MDPTPAQEVPGTAGPVTTPEPAASGGGAVADASSPRDAELLESTVFPEDEFPLPDQTPADLGGGA
ncbi:hypothetical protein [Cellulomonas endophytica]|uniref:hypothetical protein n=1 Tax=Cellulomonas endophytica TaxID=2494735 RepID=UPI001010F5A0|nr:hypothetical protein [Cellulomonas endophytica]